MNSIERIKKIIKSGGTIDDAATEFGVVPRTIRVWLKESYKNEKCYKNLLEKARLNKLSAKHSAQAAKEAEKEKLEKEREEEILAERTAKEKALMATKETLIEKLQDIRNTVTDLRKTKKLAVVCETGYLLTAGYEGIWGIEAPIYLPAFCFSELDKHCDAGNEMAIEVAILNSNFQILNPVKLAKETLTKFAMPRKQRSKGVVAVCCELASRGKQVILLTNSIEISTLASFQEIGITIIKI